MYYQSQPGGFYGTELGNVEGMEAIAGGFNHDLSYPKIPGRDVQGIPNANDPVMREKLRQRLLNNPGGGEDLPGFVKKAEGQFGNQNPLAFGSSNLPNAVTNMGGQFPMGNMGGLANSTFTQAEAPFGEVAGILDGIFGRKSKPLKPGEKPTMDELGTKTGERMMERKRATEEAIKMMRGGSSSSEINPFEALLAQNQGPSTPVKYYPDAFGGQGGILPNRGAAGPGNVRPKGSVPLAQDLTEDPDGMEQMLAQLRENQSSLPNGFINKYVS